MLAREMFIKEFGYNSWANGRILDQAQEVTDEQWTLQADAEGRSLQETLAHLFIVEHNWRLVSAHGSVQEDQVVRPEQLPDVAAMRAFSNTEAQLMQVLLDDWSDEAFSDEVEATRWDGSKTILIRWHILQHLLLHSMQHRSEAAMLLTGCGHSPGDLDFIFYV